MPQRLAKTVSLILFMIIALSASATGKGEKAVGLRAGYNTSNEAPVAGLWFQYSFSRHFRLAPNVDYVFRHRGVDGYHFNINAHFPVGVSSRFDVYPIAGIGLVSKNNHYAAEATEPMAEESDDVTTRVNRFGLNFGAGLEYYCTRSLKIYTEGKFSWIKDYNSGVFSVGIGYVF